MPFSKQTAASLAIPSTSQGCYNFGADAENVLINWAADDTYVTIFNLHDCQNPINLTLPRKRPDNDKPPTLCAQVATGDGASGQTNMKGWPGSVRIGQGDVPKPDPSFIYGGVPSSDDLNALTGFFGFDGCSNDQKKALGKAATDMLKLAYAAVPYNAKPDETIDWNSAAALEYFGPPSRNEPYRAQIIDDYQKAGLAYSRWGDWWKDRYVQLRCTNERSDAVAYTENNKDDKYSRITFTASYFGFLTHTQALGRMKENERQREWVSSLESQATIFFHELLHVRKGKARVCKDCIDQQIRVGPDNDKKAATVYGAGASKLLAKYDAFKAATNNDNLLNYAMAMFIQNQFSK